VIAGAIPDSEIEYPMAIVILGDVVTSTLLNLFVVPSLYLCALGTAEDRRLKTE
jgi:Cu/Ag efflux pump CusA